MLLNTKQLQEVIEKLSVRFPDKLPLTPDVDLSRLLGQQDVVKFFIELLEREELNNALPPKTIHKR